jgi:hypothetical protein
MVVNQRGTPGVSERVRKMATNTAGKPSVGMAARFAYAAGAAGILANLFLIALYVLLGL